MLKYLTITFRKMSKKNLIKDTLSKNLKKQNETTINDVVDIEDFATTSTKSLYFSPLQTRRQRQNNQTKKTQPKEETNLEPKVKSKSKTNNEIKSAQKVETKLVTQKSKPKTELKSESKMKSNIEQGLENVSKVRETVKLAWEPDNWELCLDNIRKMRNVASAPVDTMGCHKCSDDDADEKTQRFQKLVALMLSSQTKDETTFDAMQRLKNNGLTPESIVAMETTKLEQLVHPVSFYKNKSKYLQQTARILIDKYDSDIPNNIKDLVALPGVGPKMAHICMATAWQQVTGIGVDVHVHRISNRLRWVQNETKQPEQTRLLLESWLPRDLWQEVNHLLVGFGQTVCTPVRPNCANCLNRDICPSAEKTAKIKAKPKSEQSSADSEISPIKKYKYQPKKQMHS
ncbi:endonuclease III-like protein 1 [Teleopsis dalmanni]|uniref:endonuclease III-like protein 1 n=1 Tax=Teleopsis dalmanni TaxID=139649 RepID=UPI0018CDB0EF|nr:endonuclease III-like protein 1 [Teleopsis dalmanni]